MIGMNHNFFQLPLELRQQIYIHYLRATYLPVLPTKHRRRSCHSVFYHHSIRDIDAISDSEIDQSTLSSTELPTLIIEIDPRTSDSLMGPQVNMRYLWHSTQRLCDDLRRAPLILSLSIHFLKGETAKWSSNGKPT